MVYRDEVEALRARVAELERELALSEALVARLLGRDGASKTTSRPDSIVGEVVHRVDETSLDASLDDAGLEAVASVVRARLGHEITRRGQTLEGHRSRLVGLAERRQGAFGVASNEHGTSLRLETDLRRLPLLVAVGPTIGACLALPLVLFQLNELHHFRDTLSASTSMAIVVLTMLLSALVGRAAAARVARREHELHRGVWAALLEVTRAHAKTTRVRVLSPAEDEMSEPLDERARARSRAEATRA